MKNCHVFYEDKEKEEIAAKLREAEKKYKDLKEMSEIQNEKIVKLREILRGDIKEKGNWNPLKGKWEINYSSILTKLIQEAGRWCEYYASDLFAIWKYNVDAKLENAIMETCNLVFAFRDSGVDNNVQYEIKGHQYDEDYYRAVWFLDIATNEGKITMHLHK